VTDLRLCELLAARICHDLVGPVGAVSNGIELLAQDDMRLDAEVVALIETSARSAGRRLQAYRIAFGSLNALPQAGFMATARDLAAGLIEDGKVTLDWVPFPAETEAAGGKRLAKTVLNLVIASLDSMPRGGTLRVEGAVAGRTLTLSVSALGGQARMPDEVRTGLEGVFDLENATPKAAPAYLAALLAREQGGTLTVSGDPAKEFTIRLTAPARS